MGPTDVESQQMLVSDSGEGEKCCQPSESDV